MTTLFWVGEPSDADNAFIPNDVSYWDKEWQSSYGGVDDPKHRNGYWPADFRPKENPFYVALPFGEFESDRGHDLKRDAQNVPWYSRGLAPLLKNHWVEIKLGDRTCYAQWQDVGPFEVDDFAFVFGNAKNPQNTFDARAGLDVSPAVWHYLGNEQERIYQLAFFRCSRCSHPDPLDGHYHHLGQQSFDLGSKRCRWAHVCFGSLADITTRSRHVRLTPDSGHSSAH